MANSKVKVELVGEAKIRQAFDRLGYMVSSRAKEIINDNALKLMNQARKNAPVDMGQLRSSIRPSFYNNGLTAEVGTDVGYGAFVEFGTGPVGRATFPSLFGNKPDDYVWGPGGFFPPLQPIKDWCRRHSIPEKMAFVIARKIGKYGLKAQPYMFPAWDMVRPQFEKELHDLIPQWF